MFPVRFRYNPCCVSVVYVALGSLNKSWFGTRSNLRPLVYTHVAFYYQQSLLRCITGQDVYVQKLHAAKRLLPNLKQTFEDLRPCYCYAIRTNTRTIRSQVWQPASAGKGAGIGQLQPHHCMTPEQWTWLLCKASATPANKLALQGL